MQRSVFQSAITAPGERISLPIEFFDDFLEGGYTAGAAAVGKFSQTADAGVWLSTVTQAGGGNATITIADGSDAGRPGGALKILNDSNDNDAVELQVNGESFTLTTGLRLVFKASVKVTDVSETDWFIGVADTDTDVLGGANDSIGFRCPDSTGDIDVVTEDDTTETVTDTTKDLADATWVDFAFEYDGADAVRFYVNGALVATHRTNLPDTGTYLTPTIAVRNDGAVAQSMYVDYVYVGQERP